TSRPSPLVTISSSRNCRLLSLDGRCDDGSLAKAGLAIVGYAELGYGLMDRIEYADAKECGRLGIKTFTGAYVEEVLGEQGAFCVKREDLHSMDELPKHPTN